jgi:2-desacetyl-2-hydroxyethyl bacteriochlorophyllide A dehydrogenase
MRSESGATGQPEGSAVVRFAAPKVADVVRAAPFRAEPGFVRIRTLYSGISAGTELTAFLGTNPYLHSRWDAGQRLFLPGEPTFSYPVTGWGSEEVGEVVETGPGVTGPVAGDRVWGIWGHRSDGLLPADVARGQRIPPEADIRLGVFARPGAVALNAVIEADVHVGETVAVFGQGVIGQLASQLVRLSGAEVVAVDLAPQRLEMARRLGAHHVVPAGDGSPATRVRELTDGRGADVCIELSGTYAALHEAVRTVGYGGRVVAAGFYQGGGAALRLGEEFHHNRVEIVGSQISGTPLRYANRWTRERLHREFMRLAVSGRIEPLPLITNTVPVYGVQHAFETLAAGDPATLQVILDFTGVG